MRLQTKHFLEKCWDSLENRKENHWNDKEHFLIWAIEQSEVDSRAYNTYLTKIDPDEMLGPENARIVNVIEDEDWNYIEQDAIAFMEIEA